MQTLIVKTENAAAAKLLLAFLKTVSLVKSVTLASSESNAKLVNEPSETYNWINPTRVATDEEIEQMLDECEASPELTAEEAKALTLKEIREWKKSK